MSFDEVVEVAVRIFNAIAGPVILIAFIIVVAIEATIVVLPVIESLVR